MRAALLPRATSFLVASLHSTRHQPPVAKKTLNPVYAPKDATWDFQTYGRVADTLGAVEEGLSGGGSAAEDWFRPDLGFSDSAH
ncbi:hypothetical protein K438DRAFT_1973910 [Mycena galopus ATCC 62051]|nr:hypothetical protein K438DRAFT_1973910 [Mycena galopus ATCC 62051]